MLLLLTMGSWFRDYVYIPMGGNRVSKLRWLLNIAVVWMLTGLWHGADWNFILWGVMMAVMLVLEKFVLGKLLARVWRGFSHIYTMFFILISFVLFNGAGLSGAWTDVSGLFGAGGTGFIGAESLYYLRSFGWMFILAAFCSTPLLKKLGYAKLRTGSRWTLLEPALVALILILVTANLVDGSFNPFIYFRF